LKEIEFSVMEGRPGESDELLPLMGEFEKQHHIHVNIVKIPWKTAWAQNVKFGIHGHGPDISAVGASWIGSLASMQALRPFTPVEIQTLGGADIYFESIWQVGQLINTSTVWAIPWLGDVRVLFYWKDVLRESGIENFDDAFKTDTVLVETLEKLSKNGYTHPLALTTQAISQTLHEAAFWVWSAGGDFISQDGKKVIFNQPKALLGFKKYFSLRPYISPTSLQIDSGDLFRNRTSPVHLAGLWVPSSIESEFSDNTLKSQLIDHLGVAELPGIAYMGGTSLVIWQYSSKFREAFELIHFLSDQPIFYNNHSQHYNQLPTRREALKAPATENDPFNRTYLQAFQSGRSFPTLRLWGSIEDKLIPVIAKIWEELFADPDQDLDACLHRNLDPLAERLNMVLGN
jgi:multiple sugar transport system substrate-binding protein